MTRRKIGRLAKHEGKMDMRTQINRGARLSAQRLLAGASLGFVLASLATPAFAQEGGGAPDAEAFGLDGR